jgi:hypothetical protein
MQDETLLWLLGPECGMNKTWSSVAMAAAKIRTNSYLKQEFLFLYKW